MRYSYYLLASHQNQMSGHASSNHQVVLSSKTRRPYIPWKLRSMVENKVGYNMVCGLLLRTTLSWCHTRFALTSQKFCHSSFCIELSDAGSQMVKPYVHIVVHVHVHVHVHIVYYIYYSGVHICTYSIYIHICTVQYSITYIYVHIVHAFPANLFEREVLTLSFFSSF